MICMENKNEVTKRMERIIVGSKKSDRGDTEEMTADIDALNHIYTPLEEAKEEIWRRWNDKVLRGKVENFFGGDIPEFLVNNPKAYLARHVASPNFSFLRFVNLSKQAGLNWVCPEYLQDKFVSKNQDKYFLGKLFFYHGTGKHGGVKTEIRRIIDFNSMEGKSFGSIMTLTGDAFHNFHHSMLKNMGIEYQGHIPDFSFWLEKMGGTPEKFYPYLLALFIRNAVLFDNFLCKGPETDFIRRIFIPSFAKVEEVFGIKPLIVNLVPRTEEHSVLWFYYPESANI